MVMVPEGDRGDAKKMCLMIRGFHGRDGIQGEDRPAWGTWRQKLTLASRQRHTIPFVKTNRN